MRLNRSTAALAFCALGACFAIAEARAQSVELEDDRIRVMSIFGTTDTEIGLGSLHLGAYGGQAGEIRILDANGFLAFEVDSTFKSVRVTEELNIREESFPPTIRMDGTSGNIDLGGNGHDGDITLEDDLGSNSISLDGNSSTAANNLDGNGFIKGWARIAADGTVTSSYNCDPSKTERAGLGEYYVDFGPIDGDITTRPRMAVLDRHGTVQPTVDRITLDDDTSSTSRIRVITGPAADHSFTITVF
jgi:hypothetical protein